MPTVMNHRILHATALAITAATAVPAVSADSVKRCPVAEGYSATSVNTAVFRASSLTTRNGTQYISY